MTRQKRKHLCDAKILKICFLEVESDTSQKYILFRVVLTSKVVILNFMLLLFCLKVYISLVL